MPKTIKFNLILDGKPVRDIEGLQENFCIDDVLQVYKIGLLERWLQVRGFDDYLKKVKKIKKDNGIIKQLIKIFEIKKSEKEIMGGIYSLSFWNDRKIEIEEWSKKNYKITQIIADYHNGYDTLKQQIIEHKFDMPFLKQSTKEIYDTYSEIFKIDYKYFFDDFAESVPLVIFAILMHKNLRKTFLENNEINKILSSKMVFNQNQLEKFYLTFTKSDIKRRRLYSNNEKKISVRKNDSNKSDSSNQSVNSIVSNFLLTETNKGEETLSESKQVVDINFPIIELIIDGKETNIVHLEKIDSSFNEFVEYLRIIDINDSISLSYFSGQTEDYWKDIEPKNKKFMIISMQEGNFIRSTGNRGEELSASDINGKFLIINGIDYKSNKPDDKLIYMEV